MSSARAPPVKSRARATRVFWPTAARDLRDPVWQPMTTGLHVGPAPSPACAAMAMATAMSGSASGSGSGSGDCSVLAPAMAPAMAPAILGLSLALGDRWHGFQRRAVGNPPQRSWRRAEPSRCCPRPKIEKSGLAGRRPVGGVTRRPCGACLATRRVKQRWAAHVRSRVFARRFAGCPRLRHHPQAWCSIKPSERVGSGTESWRCDEWRCERDRVVALRRVAMRARPSRCERDRVVAWRRVAMRAAT